MSFDDSTPTSSRTLLTKCDPPPYVVEREHGASPFFFTCDHGGRLIPRALGDLGVSESERARHIAWDIGVAELGKRLAAKLDAFLITQAYSRLVIDCNRHPGSAQSIVTVSERTEIPGNVGLSDADRIARAAEIFYPYHDRIVRELDARAARKQATVLVTLHSFTPIYMDSARGMQAGVLYNRDARLGQALLGELRAGGDIVVGDNEPYAATEITDYALVVHGERRGLIHVEIEVRQDLIEHSAGQDAWAARLERVLPRALAQVSP
jgi:predicted N-formylglutamate amidohydrolase